MESSSLSDDNAYKPTSFGWLSTIPKGWKESKIKFEVKVVCGATPESSKENYWDGEIPWITPADMKEIGEISRGSRSITGMGYYSCGTSLIPKGSIVISCRAPIGKINITTDELCTNQGCKSIIRDHDNRFLYYQLITTKEIIEKLGRGTTFLELSTYDLDNFPIYLPSVDEQHAIADHLDAHASRIDQAIRQTEEAIELLNRYRRVQIHECVTRGLTPGKSRETGIPWMKTIPEHWQIMPIRYIAKIRSGATPSKNKDDFWNGSIPWVSSGEVKCDVVTNTTFRITEEAVRSCSTQKYPVGTPIMVVRSGILKHTIPVANLGVEATINQDIKVFEMMDFYDPIYFRYFIQGNNDALLNVLTKDKSTVESIDDNLLKNCKIACPPIEEQRAIADYLDKRVSGIDHVLSLKRNLLDRLREYRESYINEYVTGKKRVAEVIP